MQSAFVYSLSYHSMPPKCVSVGLFERFCAKNRLCSYEFEDSFDICGKYGDGSLHLHGVKTV